MDLQISTLDCGTNLSHWHTDVSQRLPKERDSEGGTPRPEQEESTSKGRGQETVTEMGKTRGSSNLEANGSPLRSMVVVLEAAEKQER